MPAYSVHNQLQTLKVQIRRYSIFNHVNKFIIHKLIVVFDIQYDYFLSIANLSCNSCRWRCSITKIRSAQSIIVSFTFTRALADVPADLAWWRCELRKIASAVGLRHLFLLQIKIRFIFRKGPEKYAKLFKQNYFT
jgi:hypothetical protein